MMPNRLATPRAAGLAGVLFSLLFATSMVLIHSGVPEGAAGSQWLYGSATHLRWASILMPFAGIAFLWFIAVVRDGLGRYEDRFFATVFFGSGLLFLAMMFTAAAVGAALLASRSVPLDTGDRDTLAAFGQALLVTVSNTFALRMGAVFMLSLATIWLKTSLMPRWLVYGTYAGAVVLLVASDVSMWLVLVFPAWVLVVSMLALVKAGVIHLHHDDPEPHNNSA